MDDTIDGRREIKKDKQAQTLLRQFLNTDGPAKAQNKAYDRGYEFSFQFTQEQRELVNWLMEEAKIPFEEAFDAYKQNLKDLND